LYRVNELFAVIMRFAIIAVSQAWAPSEYPVGIWQIIGDPCGPSISSEVPLYITRIKRRTASG
jgi:hypothetical protein